MTRKPSLDSAETGADIFQSWPFTYGPSKRKIPPGQTGPDRHQTPQTELDAAVPTSEILSQYVARSHLKT